MPLPDGVPMFTLVAEFPPLSADGAERTGTLTFTPVPNLLADAAYLYTGVENATLNATGGVTKTLVANDALDEAFVWRIDGDIAGMPPWSVNISVPASAGTVSLGAVAEFEALPTGYTVVPGPQGPEGPAGSGTGTPASTVVAETGYGQASAAGTASSYSRGDHTHGTPAVPRLDQVGAPVADVAMGGHKLTGLGDGVASSDAATVGQLSAAGGGSSVRTASVRITDDNLSGLLSASAWAVVLTSGGTPLQCSIAAAAGDRIRVCGLFMRNGSHYLDWVLLDSGGAIAEYATTGTGTAPTEGNPIMYPSLSFSYVTGADWFVVGSGNIDGTGKITVALAHQGTGSGVVYAHPTYPWRLRLENLGPEPS